ncbi:Superinfection immunity protein [Faunimonas pinastri]|uniref:Superinfection immunity protein n=1 Tax=Faunimonas pinastri TaxID=1855383 RepID=A0A1H9MZC0_9HYPH|nr:superinfection immunity protein [Faunimonas pinastri]SER29022.1 Superinfection immunity protein [Faunimonas pinastri]
MNPDVSTGLLLIVILIALYLLPAIIAFSRGHHNRVAILVLNLLLGWSVLGWIAALVWSFTAVERAPGVIYTDQRAREPRTVRIEPVSPVRQIEPVVSAEPPASLDGADIEEHLRHLEALRGRGVITEEELRELRLKAISHSVR